MLRRVSAVLLTATVLIACPRAGIFRHAVFHLPSRRRQRPSHSCLLIRMPAAAGTMISASEITTLPKGMLTSSEAGCDVDQNQQWVHADCTEGRHCAHRDGQPDVAVRPVPAPS